MYTSTMKILAKNARAGFDYVIEDRIVAGVVLTGPEVKSVRNGSVQLKGSYVHFLDGELFLINTHISKYKFAADQPHEETRSRKLLVTKKQLKSFEDAKKQGRHLFPTAIGLEKNRVKVEIGIGTSTKRVDKRQRIKKREDDRSVSMIGQKR